MGSKRSSRARNNPDQIGFSFAPPLKKKKEKRSNKWNRASTFSGGLVVPRPTNEYGELYDEGSLGVYLRTDGIFVVLDRSKPLGKWTVAAHRTVEGAIRSLSRLSKTSS